MKKMFKFLTPAAVCLMLVIGLCVLPAGCTQTEQGAGTGAVLGAGLGAIIGHQSGNAGAGAAIGAAGGAIAGGMVGSSREKAAAQQQPAREIVKCPHCGAQVDVTGFPPGSKVRCPQCNGLFSV